MPSDGDIREQETTTNSRKDVKCNTSKARHNMQQPLREKSSDYGRSTVISRQWPTHGTKLTNWQWAKEGTIQNSHLSESPMEH